MKVVSLKDLKKNLHMFTELVHKGTHLLVTRYNKPYVVIVPNADSKHLLVGSRFGKGKLTPAVESETDINIQDILDKDRDSE